jgi:hypothetical protein
MLRPHNILERCAVLTLGLAMSLGAQTQPAQDAPQTPAKKPVKSAPAPPAKAAPAGPALAKAPAKTPAPAAKPAKQKAAAPAKPPAKAVKPPAVDKKNESAAVVPAAAHRRDPFLALLSGTSGPGVPPNLPPGKAGLQVSTLRVDGVVRSANGMMVVVTSPKQRTFFLRQGDRLFDGQVEQITMDSVTFRETGKDPFNKPIERTVVKRINVSAGDQ